MDPHQLKRVHGPSSEIHPFFYSSSILGSWNSQHEKTTPKSPFAEGCFIGFHHQTAWLKQEERGTLTNFYQQKWSFHKHPGGVHRGSPTMEVEQPNHPIHGSFQEGDVRWHSKGELPGMELRRTRHSQKLPLRRIMLLLIWHHEKQGKLCWYCGWKKSCITLDGWNPMRINHLSTGAGFLPSTVSQTFSDFFFFVRVLRWVKLGLIVEDMNLLPEIRKYIEYYTIPSSEKMFRQGIIGIMYSNPHQDP